MNQILHDLHSNQWCQVDGLFPKALTQSLYEDLLDLDHQGQLKPAQTGRDKKAVINALIRGDRILWLEEKDPAIKLCQQQVFLALQDMKAILNEVFYLNLKKIEFHYALYPKKSHYDKHIDQHRGQNQRVITFLHYLNPYWTSECGGLLRIFDPSDPDQILATIQPKMGSTLLFLSEVFPHEVEISTRERLSFTGWFRTDDEGYPEIGLVNQC